MSSHEPTQDAVSVGSRQSLYVDILAELEGEGNDLRDEVPTIGVIVDGRPLLLLTWSEAYELARALATVAGIAEHG